MDISFEHHNILTISAKLAKQTKKRKHQSFLGEEAAAKKSKANPATECHDLLPSDRSQGDGQSIEAKVSISSSNSAIIDVSGLTSESLPSADSTRNSTPLTTPNPARNKGGRPRTKPLASCPSTRNLKKGTVLRVNRLVQARLPLDIWLNIFTYSKPDFLFRARSVCRSFRDALTKDAAWRQALRQQFGQSLPEPPPGLSQMNYANLLTQHGCQRCRDEHKGSTRRTYWAFQRRYCEACLENTIVYEKELRFLATKEGLNFAAVTQSIPNAMYDSWGHYQWAGDYDTPPSWAKMYPNAQKAGYLRADVDIFISEYNHQRKDATSLDQWLVCKSKDRDSLVSKIQAIENFCELNRLAKMSTAEASRHARRDYYHQQALQLNPPMTSKVLHQCESYKRAISISRQPADLERSWATLLPKLKEEARIIEARTAKYQKQTRLQNYRQDLCLSHNVNPLARMRHDMPEQRYLLTIADHVISALLQSAPHASLIPMILNSVRMMYDKRATFSQDTKDLRYYRPIMNDAKMIYDLKITPIYAGLNLGGQIQARQLKCAFCEPADVAAFLTYSFEGLFNHIQDVHHVRHFTADQSMMDSQRASGQSMPESYEKGKCRFPWLTTEWPPFLPILAAHQATPERWDHERMWDDDFHPEW